jgi:hypothetical protein
MEATLGELSEQMEKSYSVSGSSRRKAVRFFLAATTYTGVLLSPHLKSKSRGSEGGAPTVRRRRSRTRVAGEPEAPQKAPASQTGSTSRVVSLKSGGTVTLPAGVDFLALDQAERDFVFKLIDELKQYETK